ncbi:hypothetical protein [Helicobacter sp. WB40]|uniref:hypothetical protein n=1 Tax=Helicobacter sp. WB40 TaxID=3004130 RepID=UPI0022EBC103|nr:hypothetical protein [Helicobacter sp. WB40]MDA3967375.1 hypothetical protein [Helicobacter sp. WB40]
MGLFDGWKKDRQRYYEEKLREYEAINQKYGLGLAFEDYEPIAWEYADRRAKSERGWLESIFDGGNIFEVVFNFFVAAVSVAITIISGGTLTAVAIAIVSSAISVINKIHTLNVIDKAVFLSSISNMLESAKASLEALSKSKEQRDQLTHLIVYEPYSILANGEVYHAQKAGSESYSPSIAYDPNKGILGEFRSDEVDEIIQNRWQTKKAGNIEYMENIFQTRTRQSTFKFSTNAQNDSLENNARRAHERITEGFNELCVLYFNILGTAQALYERTLERQVKPFYSKIVNNDFLEKNTHYSKGLKADFNYQKVSDYFKTGGDSGGGGEPSLDDLFDKWQQIQDSEFLSCYSKAEEYANSIAYVYSKLEPFLEKDISFYPMRTPLNTSTNINLGIQAAQYVNKLKAIMPEAKVHYLRYINAKTHKEAKEAHKAYDSYESEIWINAEEIDRIYRMQQQNMTWHFPMKPYLMKLKAHGVATRDRRQVMVGINKYRPITPKKVKFSSMYDLKKERTLREKIEFYERRFKLRTWSLTITNIFNREETFYYLILDFLNGSGKDYYHGTLVIDEKTHDLFSREIPKNPCIETIDLDALPPEPQTPQEGWRKES